MSLKYQPKKYIQKNKENNKPLAIVKITSISIIALSLITIIFCIKKSPETKAARRNQNIFPATVEPANANLASANAANANQFFRNQANEPKTLATSKTKISDTYSKNKYQKNRTYNIKQMVKSINNVVLQPGEDFSFNKFFNKKKLKKAYSLVARRNIKGGGISQVSTTLFQAIRNSGIQITERHKIRHNVKYSQKKNSAVFSSKKRLDFKFRNNKNFPIKIKAHVDKNCINIKIIRNN